MELRSDEQRIRLIGIHRSKSAAITVKATIFAVKSKRLPCRFFGYDFEQGTNAQLTVSNLLDEHPPRIYNGFYSAADVNYDFMGRYVGLTLRHEF